MDISVIPVKSGQEARLFFSLPFAVHAGNPLWVPPLVSRERALLTPGAHPFWESASREMFLALRGGRPVGRIAAIVDKKYNDYAGEKCGSFGFFECENDAEAAHALLDAARDWLASAGMTFMRGPLNPSANYTCGLLVDGFDKAPVIMMPWNPEYYPILLESWRLRKEQDLFAWLIERATITTPDWLDAEIARLKTEGLFTRRASSKSTLEGDIRLMLDIYRQAWAGNWGFSPLSGDEAEELVRELKPILNPDFFVLFFHNGKAAAGMVALPDMNPLLKRLNGRPGISAPWHWLRTREQIRSGYRIMLFGIRPEYRLLGLPSLLLDYLFEKARENPYFQWVEGSWVLEDNVAVNDLLEDFSGTISKRYRIYRREIRP
jgi:GNAT superfamily N-acetyltransferase